MAKVGRPKNDRIEAFVMLIFVRYLFEGFRRAGYPYASAITYTVAKFREMFPDRRRFRRMRISESGVRAILAEHNAISGEEVLIVNKVPEEKAEENISHYRAMLAQAEQQGYPDLVTNVLRTIVAGNERSICLEFRADKRATYPRINARQTQA